MTVPPAAAGAPVVVEDDGGAGDTAFAEPSKAEAARQERMKREG